MKCKNTTTLDVEKEYMEEMDKVKQRMSRIPNRICLTSHVLTVGNSPSVSQSPTLDKKDKVKHYIRIKVHNTIALRFWVKVVSNTLCVCKTDVIYIEPQSLNDHNPHMKNI